MISVTLKQGWWCALPITPEQTLGVGAANGAIRSAQSPEAVFAPSDADARVFDIAERILALGTALAIVTLITSIAQRIFPIGATGCQHHQGQ